MRKLGKKAMVIFMVAVMGMMLAACGKETADAEDSLVETQPIEEETQQQAEEGTVEESAEEEPVAEETGEENGAAEDSASEEVGKAQEENAEAEASASEEAQSENAEEQGYQDNFEVDAEAAAEFAGKIQAAVAEKNLETLADLTAYPVYVGFEEGGISVNAREELIELGAEKIFTQELMDSVAGADIQNLSPSMAGFSVTKDGAPNIVFGVREGKLAIGGINY